MERVKSSAFFVRGYLHQALVYKSINKKSHRDTKTQRIMTENEIGKVVVDSAIAVHNALGSGLYEIVYEVVLAHELKKHGINVDRQVPVSIEYDGIRFGEGRNFKNYTHLIMVFG